MIPSLPARRGVGALLVVASLLALGGCGGQGMPPQHVSGDPRAGLSTFKFAGCGACHAIAGVSVGTDGPALNSEGDRRTVAWLRALLPGHLRATHSPALPARDRHDLLSYLVSLR